MTQTTPHELQARLQGNESIHLLDVREPHEHALVALPNATLLPLGSLPERVKEIQAWKDEAVVVYCHHGIRSQHAIAFLQSLGFQYLENLQGGIDAWAVCVDPTMNRY